MKLRYNRTSAAQTVVSKEKSSKAMELSLDALVKIVEPIETILQPTFGPCGGDVLVESATGGIVTLSDGATVLRSLVLSHPVAKLLVDAALKRRLLYGDGSSSFILMVSAALRELKRSHMAKSNAYLARLSRCLGSYRRTVLQKTVLRQLVSSAVAVAFNSEDDRFWKEAGAIAKACLCEKFSSATCEKLRDMAVNGVRELAQLRGPDCGNIVAALRDVVVRFRAEICLEVAGESFSRSAVLVGLLLKTDGICEEALKKLFIGQNSFSARVLLVRGEVHERSELATSITLSSVAQGVQLLNWRQARLVRAAEQLAAIFGDHTPLPRIVVYSATCLPEGLLSECAAQRILLVSCHGDDELERLAVQWCTSYATWEEVLTFGGGEGGRKTWSVSSVESVRRCIYAGQSYLHLPPRSCSSSGLNFDGSSSPYPLQVIVCSMSATLCRMYSSAVLDCCRTLLQWCEWPLEKITSLFLGNVVASEADLSSCEAHGPTEEETKPLKKTKVTAVALPNGGHTGERQSGSNGSLASLLLSLPAGGTGEILMYFALVEQKATMKDECDRDACQALAAACLACPKTLHSNSAGWKRFSFLRCIEEFEQQWCRDRSAGMVDPWTGQVHDQAGGMAFEPLMTKFHLLCDVCSCIEQLLRIDTVVAAAKKPVRDERS